LPAAATAAVGESSLDSPSHRTRRGAAVADFSASSTL
jgi:hypothetical protein